MKVALAGLGALAALAPSAGAANESAPGFAQAAQHEQVAGGDFAHSTPGLVPLTTLRHGAPESRVPVVR